MEKIKKNDFIELKFTGKVVDGEIFDTNIPSDAEKINLKIDDKQFIICVGQKMVIEGLDDALIDKEVNKKFSVEIPSTKAFGERKREMVKLIPLKVFREKNINPQPGMTLHMDNHLVRIASVSGGRILVDFNNPLSGKDVAYDFTITKKVTDDKEKIDAIINYFIKQPLTYELKDKKATFEADQFMAQMIKMLNDKFKDILDIEFVVKEKKEETTAKQTEQ
tara:strand:+ start:457 stop:1119 length:663 start_codon:yes stop_codon:yes gene_type:complete